jgi:acyl carrier protein
MDDVQQELHGFIAAEIAAGRIDSIDAEEDLIRSGIVDSVGIQQLVQFCETRYGVEVQDADLVPENFRSLRALSDFVVRKQHQGPPAQRSRLRVRRG